MQWLNIVIYILTIMTLIGCGTGLGNPELPINSGAGGYYDVQGFIQKGPFIQGSTITIQELDDTFTPTGVTYGTVINDDFGSFALSREFNSGYVEIIANGFYFNEVSGELSRTNITLRAIADLASGEAVNINVLTTLARERIEYLIANTGMTFAEAKAQAKTEILGIFHITDEDISNFEEMDISQEGNSNAALLAISAILQGANTEAQLSEFVSKISSDIKEDGVLNLYIDELTNNAGNLDLAAIRTNLENRYVDLGLIVLIPAFEDYVDSDGDEILNKFDYTLSYPIGGTSDTTPAFDWTDSGFAGVKYHFQLASDENFEDIIEEVTDLTESTYTCVTTLSEHVTYYWRIFVVDENGDKYNWAGYGEFMVDTTGKIDWLEANSSAAWGEREGHSILEFDGKIWLFGGWLDGSKNDIWNSEDGVNWTEVVSSAEWSARYNHCSVVFNNKLWVLGGNINKDDVWYSSDGVTWTDANAANHWSARASHACVVFDDKIWVIGGSVFDINDTWYSIDGTNWTQATVPVSWDNTSGKIGAVVFDNKLWVLYGYDVWFSADGVNWTRTAEGYYNIGSVSSYAKGFLILDNKLWIVGNSSISSSIDGYSWINAAFSSFNFAIKASTFVFNNKIWVLGGHSSASVNYSVNMEY